MPDNQALRLLRGEARQGQAGFKEFAHIRYREGGQEAGAEIGGQGGITWRLLGPLQFGLGDKPGGEDGEREGCSQARYF